MDNVEKLFYAADHHLPVNITFTDGFIAVGVYLIEATGDDFIIEPTKKYLRACDEKGHDSLCIGEYEDVVDVELVGMSMTELDEQVRKALESVPRAYDDFVSTWKDFRGKPEEQMKLLDFIKNHPEANAGVVLEEIVFKIMPELLESDEDIDSEEQTNV